MAAEHSGTDEDEYYEVDDLEEMHTAIVNNDYGQLHEACEAGADVNEKFTEDIDAQHAGMTALALASALNRLDLVKMLLDYGAEVNSTFATLETTALMTSSFHGHAQIVRTLLDHGASAKTVDSQGSTALGYAFGGSKSVDVVKMLLSAGVDVNQKNMLGMNALLLVAGYGNDHLVRLIIQSGADPTSTNDFGHTALHLAIVGKRSQVAQLRGDRGSTSLYGLNRRDIDTLLKEWCTSHRDMLGSRRPDDSVLESVGKFMMDIGAKLDEPDELPLDDQEAMKRRINAVVRYREERLQASRDSKKPGMVDTLLSCGGKRGKKARRSKTGGAGSALPSAQPKESRMPVSADVDRDVAKLAERCARIMREIIDARCPVDNTESTFGMTPLDMAVLMGDVESTAQLLAAGADPDHLLKLFALTDLYDVTVVHPDRKKTRELLDDDDKIDVNQPYASFNITKGTNAPRSVGSPGDAQTPISDDGLTPVAAATKGSSSDTPEIIKMLVKHGADIKKVGPAGRSALGEACRTDNVRNVQTVVNSGADIEQPNPYFKNATPVVIAVICKNPKVVEYLVGKGAKLDKPMVDGRTSLIKAMEGNNMPMIDTLLGADKNQNFTDKNGFMYEMVELYQREDRDIEKILKSISDKVRQFQEEDRLHEQKAKKDSPVADGKPQKQKPSGQNGQERPPATQLRPVPPPQLDSEEESSEEEEESEDEEPTTPTHPPPPKPDAVPQKKPTQPPAPAPKPGKSKPVPQTRPPQPPQPLSSSSEEEESEEETEEESEEEASPPPPAVKPKKPVVVTAPPVQPQKPVVGRDAGKTGSPARHGPVPNTQVREAPPPPLPTTSPPGDDSEEEEEESEEESEEEEEEPVPNTVTKTSTATHVARQGGTSNTVVTRTVVTKTVKQVQQPSKAQMEELDDSGSSEEEEEEEESEDENENARRKPVVPAKPAATRQTGRRRQQMESAETDI